METVIEQLPAFKNWLIERGRNIDTADGYASDIRLAYNDVQPPLGRLRNHDLAPKTLRRTMAALRAWCKYAKDGTLLEKLIDIRLPPPSRKIAKIPLTRDLWDELVEELDSAGSYLSPAERAVIGIMAVRGIRVGDVLRMRYEDLKRAKSIGVLSYEGKQNKRLECNLKPIEEYIDLLLKEKNWGRVRDLVSPRARTENSKQSSAAQQVSRCLKILGEKIGIDPKELHPHKLRRTYATHYLAAAGGDLNKLQIHMGWSNIGTAAGYTDYHRMEELDAIADSMRKKK